MVVSFRVALCCGRLESLMYMSRLINLNLSVVGDLKDVCANCFFPFFIVHTQIYMPRHARLCMLSNKMNNGRVDGHCYTCSFD